MQQNNNDLTNVDVLSHINTNDANQPSNIDKDGNVQRKSRGYQVNTEQSAQRAPDVPFNQNSPSQ